MKRSTLYFTLLALAIFVHSAIASHTHDVAYTSFIITPQANMRSANNQLKGLLTSCFLGAAGGYAAQYPLKSILENDDHWNDGDRALNIKLFYTMLGTVSSGLLGWHFQQKNAEESYKATAAKDFIQLWPAQQQNTPHELHAHFDFYKKIYDTQQYLPSDAALTLANIAESYYKSLEMSSLEKIQALFPVRQLTSSIRAELGSALRGCADIIRSIRR